MAPRDINPGAVYDEAILDAIDGASAVVLINCAFGKGKTIFPVRIQDVMPSRSLEFYVARYQWTDAFLPAQEEQLDRLVAAVATVSGQEPKERPLRRDAVHAAGGISSEMPRADSEAGPELKRGFVLVVHDIFLIEGRGTCVTGVIEEDTCRLKQRALILRADRKVLRETVIEGIAISKKVFDSAEPGHDVGLLLRSVQMREVSRGMIVEGLLDE